MTHGDEGSATRARRAGRLAALLVACASCAPTASERMAGYSCPQNHCESHPSAAPSAAASGFADCEATREVPWASPNPRPFSAELTRQERAKGDATACCYEAQRLCGGGRPLLVEHTARLAPLTVGRWG